MKGLITVDDVTQVFPLPGGGQYVALKDIDLTIAEGEFVSLIGHSGCGKSTLLNLLAGLTTASSGGIILDGREVTAPGPDRMVVFQNYSLLPWQTVRQNINLAVANVLRELPLAERQQRVEENLALVGLKAAADRYPSELSGGMRQRVAIARALSIQPRLLLLDEPFGALDALTRGNLQQQLMQICQQTGITTVMVTHDVDEALLLSDRVVMLTNGPEARIGQILTVPLPRPRERLAVMEHPDYYSLRSELIGFLQQQRRLRQRLQAQSQELAAAPVAPSAPTAPTPIRIGYLPGLDIAPLAVAMEQGLVDPALVTVLPVPFTRWQQLEEKLVSGDLDVAVTSATTPLSLALGLGGRSPWPAVTPMTVTRSGNALCLARSWLELGVRDLATLATHAAVQGRPLKLAIAEQGSMQDLLLRHWLASGGIDPERAVTWVALSPMAMQAALVSGEIDGFIAGRYRVAKAVDDGLAYVLATDREIWARHPEKVLTCSESFALHHRQALLSLCAGLMRAGQWCDDGAHRQALTTLLSQPRWLGPAAAPALQRQFDFGTGERSSDLMLLNRYHADRAQSPDQAEGAWILTQFSRWGWSSFPANRVELLAQVYRLDLCDAALDLAGLPVLRPERQPFALADGGSFDQDAPLRYLEALPFAAAAVVASVPLPESTATPSLSTVR